MKFKFLSIKIITLCLNDWQDDTSELSALILNEYSYAIKTELPSNQFLAGQYLKISHSAADRENKKQTF